MRDLSKKVKICALLTLSAVCVGPASAFSPPQYDIKAEIDVFSRTVRAHQKVTLTNTSVQPLNEIYFHIYPHKKYTKKEKKMLLRYSGFFKVNAYPEGFQAPQMEISKVNDASGDLVFNIEGDDETLLKVSLKGPLLPNETAQVEIDFSVQVPHSYGRLGWHENIFALSRWYPILSVHEDQRWKNYPFYPFHRPFYSESAEYHVELTVPQNQTVVHSGILDKEETGENNKTLIINSKLPIREFTLAMSPDYRLQQSVVGNTKINVFYLSGTEDHVQKTSDVVLDLMTFYGKQFGPYPYPEFSIAPVYLGYGGEQMSNMAFIDTRVFDLPKILDRYFDFLIAHETGHQWFYNLVGVDEYMEMWLEEGVHSHFISEYLADKYGDDASVVDLPSWLEDIDWLVPRLTFSRSRDIRYKMLARIGLDHPAAGELASFSEPSSIFAITYGKGSRIAQMLKETIGEDAFQKVFKRVFDEYRFKNLSIGNFKKLCEQESGKDLRPFFDQWLHSDDHFDVAVTKVKGNQLTLENNGKIVMPVEIEVQGKNGEEKTVSWGGEGHLKEIFIDGIDGVSSARVDPQAKWLDLDRTNNTYPREVNIRPVALYHGLYDIPALLPDDAYNLIFGPELANNGLGVKASFQKPYDYNFYSATDYEFSEEIQHSRIGYQLNNVLHSQSTLGFEISNKSDYKDGDDDLVSGKVFLRKELWPVAYGLGDINDHVSLYLVRNRALGNTLLLGGSEDPRNISYLKSDEAIIGANLHLGRYSPYPDPDQGFKLDYMIENSGHFLGATQYFYRTAIDTAFYKPVTNNSKLALRFKAGFGYPDDKNLFQLGGMEGLRGYDLKEIRGANILLGSLEYRFPVVKRFHIELFDNLISFDSLGGVVFFDGGESWYSSIHDSLFKKDAGAGLRLGVTAGSFLEKAILRLDIAKAINEPKEDAHVWFGINQSF